MTPHSQSRRFPEDKCWLSEKFWGWLLLSHPPSNSFLIFISSKEGKGLFINEVIIFGGYPRFKLPTSHVLRVYNVLSIHEWSEVKTTENDDVIYEQTPNYGMGLRSTHLSERRMLRTWGSWKLHWRRLSRRERFSWKRGQSFRRDNVEDIKRFKIVRDAIADQFCIFFNIDKKAVTTEIDKIRRTLWKPTNIPWNLDNSIFTTTREKTGKSSSYYSSFSPPNSSSSK